MNYLIPNKVYDVLKWVGLVFCPALAVFVGVVGKAWEAPDIAKIVITIDAFGTFIGMCIGASHITAINGGTSPDDTTKLGE